MLADNLAANQEREEKYLLSIPYYTSADYIVVKKGRTDIQSLEDLKGKTLELVVGSTQALAIEKWNEEHGGEIKIQYTNAKNYTDPLQDVAFGRVDAYVENLANLQRVIKDQNIDVEGVGDPVLTLPIVYLFRRDALGNELKAKVDPIIEGFKKDGTLAALSKEWTGSDAYVPK
jgi:ABC-type amino acid transport substrate-binding protein